MAQKNGGSAGKQEAEQNEEAIGAVVEAEINTFSTIEKMKTQAIEDVHEIIRQLEKSNPGITEGVATALGAGTGAVGSIAALSSMGAVSGLSAAGVTTGLAAAGGILGGGMLLGIGVLATPVAALGILGYRLGKKRKKASDATALGAAAKKIYDIQSRLLERKEIFMDELAYIKTTLEILTQAKTA